MIGFSVVDPDRRHAAPQFRQVGHIGAGGKRALAGPGQHRDALRRAVELGEGLLQLDRDRLVDRVQLFRPVDRDDRDRAAVLDGDDAHHAPPRSYSCVDPESALNRVRPRQAAHGTSARKQVYNSRSGRNGGGWRWICSRNSASRTRKRRRRRSRSSISVRCFAGEPGALGRLAPRCARCLRECRVLLCGRPRRARGADRPRLCRLAPVSRAAARRKTRSSGSTRTISAICRSTPRCRAPRPCTRRRGRTRTRAFSSATIAAPITPTSSPASRCAGATSGRPRRSPASQRCAAT